MQTIYTVIEDEGPVEVCVNLTKPEGDIGDEMVFVRSYDNDSSVYIPADAKLASELLYMPEIKQLRPYFFLSSARYV